MNEGVAYLLSLSVKLALNLYDVSAVTGVATEFRACLILDACSDAGASDDCVIVSAPISVPKNGNAAPRRPGRHS